MGISLLFCACLWTNVKALEYANVETVIVFRAMSPIAVAVCDWWCVWGGVGREEDADGGYAFREINTHTHSNTQKTCQLSAFDMPRKYVSWLTYLTSFSL